MAGIFCTSLYGDQRETKATKEFLVAKLTKSKKFFKMKFTKKQKYKKHH
jgi:hypothetical protein